MKMKFVRQEKKEDKRGLAIANAVVSGKNNGEQVLEPQIEEYFVYTPKPNYPTASFGAGGNTKSKSIKIAKDSVVYCSSGLVDRNKGTVLSYMHKAINEKQDPYIAADLYVNKMIERCRLIGEHGSTLIINI